MRERPGHGWSRPDEAGPEPDAPDCGVELLRARAAKGGSGIVVSPVNSKAVRRGRCRRAPAVRLFSILLVALAALTLVSFARPRKPRLQLRTPLEMMEFMSGGPHDADCRDCHTTHASDRLSANDHALVGPNDNTLCMTCHETPWEAGSWAGLPLYDGSAHAAGLSMVWPGPYPPARSDLDAAGKCLNCHGPHGWEDGDGKIPHLANAREEALCLTCHDGAHAGSDVRTDFLKPFAHPTTRHRGRHAGPGESTPESFGISPLNQRHAECADCHNPHVTRHEEGLPLPGAEASKRLLGVSRVLVTNGAAGSAPAYTFLAASDTTTLPVAEYQLCFKCHSSWTRQPSTQTDFGRVLNPANPSYHPIQAAGRNAGIDPAAFVSGWTAGSTMRCGDCHASDSGESRAPHGSSYEFILRRPYEAAETPRAMNPDELCFQCHSFDVYANPSAPEMVRRASRFNGPNAVEGHAEHVGSRNVSCYGCHTTHGSTSQKHLIALDRLAGTTSYTETANGGTCMASCHTNGLASYTVNYAR